MRLLIYGINYTPELTGVGKYTGEMAHWFASQGFEVRVVTAPPYYPAWKIGEGYQRKGYQREQIEGVEVWRCPLWVTEEPTGLQRMIHLVSFTLSSLPMMIAQVLWRSDWVIVIEPSFLCTPMALVTARLSGASSWLHIQDFELDAAFELGLLPKNGWFHKFATNMECWLLQRFDRVSSISVQMMSRLRTKNLSWERSVYFPNWVDTEQIYPLPRPSCLKVRLGFKENDQVVLYSGNMSSKQGLELMLEVAVQLANRSNVYFVLCGDGTARRRLESTAADLQLTNVRFLPLQPVEDLNELLNLADVHALVQRDIVADLVMPSKLTGMLASGRPVIATASAGTAIANVMSEADCGLVVRPGDPASFRAALEVMLANPDECRRWGDNGRNYVRMQFDKEQVLKAMTRQLTSYSPARGGAGHVPGNTTGARTPANFTREELLARISIDPDIYFGKPYIRGHYLWVSLVLDFLASGTTVEEILRRYPDLEETDVRACIAYGAEMARERRIQVSLASEE